MNWLISHFFVKRVGQLSLLILFWSVVTGNIPAFAQAQPIRPARNGTNTEVNQDGNRFDIDGGRRSGANLFHDFERFGLNADQVANFLSNPEIRNILGRVSGGDISVIDGLIQVTGGNSNLYLMNPAGIIFGPNARLNVPAAFTATTANGIQFEGGWFNAVGNNNYAALVGDPNGFAFTMSQPGAIINEGVLQVSSGQQLTLLGGSVINSGTLIAPGGEITIAAVPGENLVRISQEGYLLSLELLTEEVGNENLLPNAIPFTPLSLPQLLTGGNADQVRRVTLNEDGTITLSGSGLRVDPVTGTVVVSGVLGSLVASRDQPGGRAEVLGNSVFVINPGISLSPELGIPSGDAVFWATDSITIEGLPRPFARSISFIADADKDGSGSFLISENGSLSLGFIDVNISGNQITGGNITGGTITISNIPGNVLLGDLSGSVNLSNIAGNISLGDVRGEEISLSTTAGNISVDNVRGNSVSLFATAGDIEVETIRSDSLDGDIEINAGGFFRATSTYSLPDPVPIQQLFPEINSTEAVSVSAFGSINIRHGSQAFVVGPGVDVTTLDGASGTAGAITIVTAINRSGNNLAQTITVPTTENYQNDTFSQDVVSGEGGIQIAFPTPTDPDPTDPDPTDPDPTDPDPTDPDPTDPDPTDPDPTDRAPDVEIESQCERTGTSGLANEDETPSGEDCENLTPLQNDSESTLLRLDPQMPAEDSGSSAMTELELPERLTGGEGSNATEVNLNQDGQPELRGAGIGADATE